MLIITFLKLFICKHLQHVCVLQVHEVPVVNKDGLTRNIGVRYTHHYPLENNEWGEFQVVEVFVICCDPP